MAVVSVLLAPAVIVVASIIERRLGPSAAGWVAALPIAFSVAVVAVALDAGTGSAAALSLSAATYVPAQVAFGVAFARVLVRRGLVVGAAAGAVAYLTCAALIPHVPAVLAVILALVALAFAPRLMPQGRPRPGSSRRWTATALSCAAGAMIVGVAVFTYRFAGTQVAGAVGAFPTITMTLVVTIVSRDGRLAGAHALLGLVRSLPCFLTFCLVVALAAPAVGLVGIPLGLLACLAAAPATWRAVPLAHPPALALSGATASVTAAQIFSFKTPHSHDFQTESSTDMNTNHALDTATALRGGPPPPGNLRKSAPAQAQPRACHARSAGCRLRLHQPEWR